MNDILSGTYKGNTYRIKVECYPNTPAIKVQLLPDYPLARKLLIRPCAGLCARRASA